MPKSLLIQLNLDHGIVLGCPRSGTTFLMEVLNALPETECMTGTLLPIAVPHVVNQDLAPEVYDALALGFEHALVAYIHSGRFNARAPALQKWVASPKSIDGLKRALRGERSIERLIYKEPFLSLAPDFVYHALPKAKIVHIYRDGRDCANSLVRSYDVLSDEKLSHLRSAEVYIGRKRGDRYVPWWVEEGAEERFLDSTPYVRAIWMWKYMVRRCHDFFSQPEVQASGRVLTVRYEDLMSNPVPEGRRVVEFLGAEMNPVLIRELEKAHPHSIGKHERRDPDEVAAAEAVARDELALYGYLSTEEAPAVRS